ncbi:MAG: septum formation protein Maf [Saprospiraceae bacterium]|nr:septum formation protein Maf [Saprospiraceae bacterium]
MHQRINFRKIILASSSPRRKLLMEEAGFWFETIHLEFDEHIPEGMSSFKVAQHIAIEKNKRARSFLKNDEIALTADSIVILGDKIFGKPKDRADAYHMLASLSGKMHRVDTGVCLSDHHKQIAFTGSSQVYFRAMNHEEISWYIDAYLPFDKAGSYAVQEWIGLCKISEISGTYANIMGLPTDLVYEGLKNFDGALMFPQ